VIPADLRQPVHWRGPAWRIVESQEQAATRAVTGSADEQARLEGLLDENKPSYLPGSEHLHWLLKTPFRYPPLRHGSRFGRMTDPGVLYCARELETAMTESAVYLWLFRAALEDVGSLAVIRYDRTAIQFELDGASTVDLTTAALSAFHGRISDPGSYADSQALAATLRTEEVDLILFGSARRAGGVNCAVLSPAALVPDQTPSQTHWHVQLDEQACWWGRAGQTGFEVTCEEVSVAGRIPHPAL